MSKGARKSLLRHGVVLMLCSFVAKAIGAAYRLPLTNLLGAEGIGDYQLVFPVYALVLALTSSAMPVLLAREIAKDATFGYAVFRRSLVLMALLGGGGALALAALAYPLALAQGYATLYTGYLIIAPAVPAVALAAAFRGWFSANMHVGVLSGASLVEQVVKLSGLGLAAWMAPRGILFAVLGALAGVTLAELASLAWCAVAYFALGYRLGAPSLTVPLRPIWQSSVPITTSNLVMPVVSGIDSLLLVNLAVWTGAGRAEAVAQYGLLTGAVGTVTALPVVLTLAFVTLVVPVVSRAVAARDVGIVRRSSLETVEMVLALSLPCGVGLALLAPDVVGLLYPRLDVAEQAYAATLLRVAAAGVPVIALQQVFNALLQAVERSVTGAKQMAIGGAVKVVGNLVLVPLLGMLGAAVASLLCYVTVLVLHVVVYTRLTGRYGLGKALAACTFSAACMGVVLWALGRLSGDNRLWVVLNILLGALVYAILLWCAYGAAWWRKRRVRA